MGLMLGLRDRAVGFVDRAGQAFHSGSRPVVDVRGRSRSFGLGRTRGVAGALEAAGVEPEPLPESDVRWCSAANHTSTNSTSVTSAIWKGREIWVMGLAPVSADFPHELNREPRDGPPHHSIGPGAWSGGTARTYGPPAQISPRRLPRRLRRPKEPAP